MAEILLFEVVPPGRCPVCRHCCTRLHRGCRCCGQEVESVSRILIVDDEPSIREFFHLVLSEAGYAVASASDGEEALDVPGPFDLLLTDVMMPRMSGDELARQMRGRDPDVKVLYVTAFSDRL